MASITSIGGRSSQRNGVKQRRAPALRPLDWEPYKATVADLYVHQKLSLAEIIAHMRDVKGIDRHENQWKTQLRKWGMYKNKPWGKNRIPNNVRTGNPNVAFTTLEASVDPSYFSSQSGTRAPDESFELYPRPRSTPLPEEDVLFLGERVIETRNTMTVPNPFSQAHPIASSFPDPEVRPNITQRHGIQINHSGGHPGLEATSSSSGEQSRGIALESRSHNSSTTRMTDFALDQGDIVQRNEGRTDSAGGEIQGSDGLKTWFHQECEKLRSTRTYSDWRFTLSIRPESATILQLAFLWDLFTAVAEFTPERFRNDSAVKPDLSFQNISWCVHIEGFTPMFEGTDTFLPPPQYIRILSFVISISVWLLVEVRRKPPQGGWLCTPEFIKLVLTEAESIYNEGAWRHKALDCCYRPSCKGCRHCERRRNVIAETIRELWPPISVVGAVLDRYKDEVSGSGIDIDDVASADALTLVPTFVSARKYDSITDMAQRYAAATSCFVQTMMAHTETKDKTSCYLRCPRPGARGYYSVVNVRPSGTPWGPGWEWTFPDGDWLRDEQISNIETENEFESELETETESENSGM